MTPETILRSALELSPDDRCRVADSLYASVLGSGSEGELSDEFKAHLDMLLKEDEENPEEGISWEELKKTLIPKRKSIIKSE